ncbi:Phage integrase family protein [Trichlorobacter thiogenes]|uniref:Phage integrase family protein n=1 Tax=Trichlorobacter thiogenes TaxID=115783 RepID=A0A1T4KJ25_9BACT|nr:tyrosine-type recombinase/integrase [Trichlorobacter thiogenes]SJZ42419.1 Phage integrase family protein [Trichlorobacter thiogenes]
MNPNHPKAGDSIKVEPIKELKDIKAIKKLLADNPRDLAIFTIGINTKLRASDLVALTVGMVKHLQAGDHFIIKEQKTGKDNSITVNNAVYNVIQLLLATMPDVQDQEPLFQSRKGKAALTVPYINKIVKGWCNQINLKGNYGSHTLRKTFGYMHRTQFGTDIPTLMQMFNHATQKQTLTYLGIQPEEIKAAYMKEL